MTFINVNIKTKKPIKQVWKAYTNPNDIINWNFASSSWHCRSVFNDLKVNGKFAYEMAAKDKSEAFIFSGRYLDISKYQKIVYRMDDDRIAVIRFKELNDETHVEVSFEAEMQNSLKLQKAGWQSIHNNFKKYIENK